MESITFVNTIVPQLLASQVVLAAATIVGLVLAGAAIARTSAVRRLALAVLPRD